MRAKRFVTAVAVLLLVSFLPAEAEQVGKVSRVGLLLPWSPGSGASSSFLKAFREGLHELGYAEGQNLAIEYRYAEGVVERLPNLVAELVSLKVDVIVTAGTAPSLRVKQATNTIPMVMTEVADPVSSGLITRVAWPAGNIRAPTSVAADLSGKRLELLKETVPRLSRVAILSNPASQGSSATFNETGAAAHSLRLQIQSLELQRRTDLESAFKAALRRADALMVLASPLLDTHAPRIVELAIKTRLPTMFGQGTHVESGGLMYYGPNYAELHRRAATYMDRILKGAKPSDLPVVQPTKFELVINLKTAKQIGLTIPPNVLARTDKVIK